MNRDTRLYLILAAAAVGAYLLYGTHRVARSPHEWHRQVGRGAERGAALDNTLGMLTPDCYTWWGPRMRPPDWSPHRLRYPVAPGGEIERLIYGAPGVCVTPNVPYDMRGWLFNPPSEVDY